MTERTEEEILEDMAGRFAVSYVEAQEEACCGRRLQVADEAEEFFANICMQDRTRVNYWMERFYVRVKDAAPSRD